MKDIPIWVRWNRQELLRITPDPDRGWHAYYIRKKKPLGRGWVLRRALAGAFHGALCAAGAALARLLGRETRVADDERYV